MSGLSAMGLGGVKKLKKRVDIFARIIVFLAEKVTKMTNKAINQN